LYSRLREPEEDVAVKEPDKEDEGLLVVETPKTPKTGLPLEDGTMPKTPAGLRDEEEDEDEDEFLEVVEACELGRKLGGLLEDVYLPLEEWYLKVSIEKVSRLVPCQIRSSSDLNIRLRPTTWMSPISPATRYYPLLSTTPFICSRRSFLA